MALERHHKEQLSVLLAAGHARFGRVAPRRPYLDDSDGGEGAPRLTVETHPLLANLPVGAASDLTAIVNANSQITEEALERINELTPELKKQPVLQAEYANRYRYTPKITPY
jgi:hypothetical protein